MLDSKYTNCRVLASINISVHMFSKFQGQTFQNSIFRLNRAMKKLIFFTSAIFTKTFTLSTNFTILASTYPNLEELTRFPPSDIGRGRAKFSRLFGRHIQFLLTKKGVLPQIEKKGGGLFQLEAQYNYWSSSNFNIWPRWSLSCCIEQANNFKPPVEQ